MTAILWVLIGIGCLLGVLALVGTVFLSQGTLQFGAAAAIAVGFAVVPYCLARLALARASDSAQPGASYARTPRAEGGGAQRFPLAARTTATVNST